MPEVANHRVKESLIGTMNCETGVRSSAIHVTRQSLDDFEALLMAQPRVVLVAVKAVVHQPPEGSCYSPRPTRVLARNCSGTSLCGIS